MRTKSQTLLVFYGCRGIFFTFCACFTAGYAFSQETFQRGLNGLRQIVTSEAEEEDEIVTDRDSFTPSTKNVASGRLIFESSYSFIDNRSGFETHSFPEVLLRYGLNDLWELRSGWNYEIGSENSIISGNGIITEHGAGGEIEKASRFLFGIKRYLVEQQGLIPESSIIVQGTTPTSGPSSLTTLNVTPVMGWRFENGWRLDSALRFSTSGGEDDTFNLWDPSTVIKFPLGERMQGHFEYFGIASSGRREETVQHYLSPGVHYLVNRDLEVGWRTGWGLNDSSAGFFFNVGLGQRF